MVGLVHAAGTTVGAGQSHTNGDGVTLSTDAGSSGTATINPTTGNGNSSTEVVTKTRWSGTVSGIDNNDSVDVKASSKGTVSGTGGSVSLAGGCEVTVTNTDTGNGTITVNLPSGGSATVKSGSSVTFNT